MIHLFRSRCCQPNCYRAHRRFAPPCDKKKKRVRSRCGPFGYLTSLSFRILHFGLQLRYPRSNLRRRREPVSCRMNLGGFQSATTPTSLTELHSWVVWCSGHTMSDTSRSLPRSSPLPPEDSFDNTCTRGTSTAPPHPSRQQRAAQTDT